MCNVLILASLLATIAPKPATIPEIQQWEGAEGSLRLNGNDYQRLINFKKGEGQFGAEGYQIEIGRSRIKILADTKVGAYYAKRTIEQILANNPSELPCGKITDIPKYRIRGMVFDVGRLPVPIEFLYEVVDIMAAYKMNDLQLHLNDNYIWHGDYIKQGKDPFKESYAAFRLESKINGLTAKDVFYSKKDFAKLIKYAKKRGVRIVPEFDSPGHALALTRVRPDLIYQGPMRDPAKRCEMIDAANPEALKFVASVWDEYLKPGNGEKTALFNDCKVVHIGTDEFFGANEDYRKYLDGLLEHIQAVGYTPRAWGSLRAKPGNTPVRSKGVQMNIWSLDWGRAKEAIDLGYDIINTLDRKLYLVPTAGYYRMDRNLKELWENWLPNVIGEDTIETDNPQFLGASWALWNDMIGPRHTGYTYKDLREPIQTICGILAEKMWNGTPPPRKYEEQLELMKKLKK